MPCAAEYERFEVRRLRTGRIAAEILTQQQGFPVVSVQKLLEHYLRIRMETGSSKLKAVSVSAFIRVRHIVWNMQCRAGTPPIMNGAAIIAMPLPIASAISILYCLTAWAAEAPLRWRHAWPCGHSGVWSKAEWRRHACHPHGQLHAPDRRRARKTSPRSTSCIFTPTAGRFELCKSRRGGNALVSFGQSPAHHLHELSDRHRNRRAGFAADGLPPMRGI